MKRRSQQQADHDRDITQNAGIHGSCSEAGWLPTFIHQPEIQNLALGNGVFCRSAERRQPIAKLSDSIYPFIVPTVFYYSIEKHPKLPRLAVKVYPSCPAPHKRYNR